MVGASILACAACLLTHLIEAQYNHRILISYSSSLAKIDMEEGPHFVPILLVVFGNVVK